MKKKESDFEDLIRSSMVQEYTSFKKSIGISKTIFSQFDLKEEILSRNGMTQTKTKLKDTISQILC